VRIRKLRSGNAGQPPDTVDRFSGWRRSLIAYTDSRVLLTLPLGFASGLPLLLTFSTLSVRLAGAGISRAAIGAFALVGTPYALKFVWSPIIDWLPPPLPLGRRRGWGVTIQIALIVAILALGRCNPKTNLAAVGALALLVAFFSASQDIVIDAWRVEMLDEEQQGPGAGMIQTGYRIGMLVAGAGALLIAARAGWFVSYALMAALLLVGMMVFLLGPEPAPGANQLRSKADGQCSAGISFPPIGRASHLALGGAEPRCSQPTDESVAGEPAMSERARCTEPSRRQSDLRAAPYNADASCGSESDSESFQRWLAVAVIGPFKDFMQRPYWAAILLFVFGYKMGEAMAGVMAMPLYVALGFSLNEIAAVSKLVGFVATIVGALAGGVVTSRLGVIRALIFCGLLQSAGNLFYVLQVIGGHRLDYLALCVAAENVTSAMAGAALVAYLSSLCSPAFTATQYALLSSLAAVGRTLLASSAGVLAESLGWELFFLFTTIATLPALLLLAWMGQRDKDYQRPRTPLSELSRK
jgi:MFS transporter, PAT family, beta-lactamase induction signal transducer AmpG